MGKNSQRRRADRKHRVDNDPRTNGPSSQPTNTASIEHLLAQACYLALESESKLAFAHLVRSLTQVELTSSPTQRPSALITGMLQTAVNSLYENGWQPADIVHTIKRQFTARAARLAVALIAAHARTTDAIHRAPEVWLTQYEDLGIYKRARDVVAGGHDQPLSAWARADKLDPDEMITIALQVLAKLMFSPKLPLLITPPSAWGASNKGIVTAPAATRGDIDAKALKLIRALLAKAEATNFEAEAETFTAKAQQMMTRYSIDAAVLASSASGGTRTSGIETRRVHIDSPYGDEKADLLSAIGRVNGARTVWSPNIGIATIMGFPVDLHLTDLLFTSLLVQATRASAEATAQKRDLRTPSFRRAFLISFAHRIAERLEATRQRVSTEASEQYGSALVPLLADREAAVSQAFETAFPNLTSGPNRRLNASGWHAGRAAADRAHIGAGASLPAG